MNLNLSVDGQLTISYLAYESVTDTAGAHLSIKFEGQKSTYGMEAIIWKEDKRLDTGCLNTSCSIPAFRPGFVHYDVCAVIVVDGLVDKTSTDTITGKERQVFIPNNYKIRSGCLFLLMHVLGNILYKMQSGKFDCKQTIAEKATAHEIITATTEQTIKSAHSPCAYCNKRWKSFRLFLIIAIHEHLFVHFYQWSRLYRNRYLAMCDC